MSPIYILYTYKGTEPCHVYAAETQERAQAEGEKLQAADPKLGFMVLPLEAMPA